MLRAGRGAVVVGIVSLLVLSATLAVPGPPGRHGEHVPASDSAGRGPVSLATGDHQDSFRTVGTRGPASRPPSVGLLPRAAPRASAASLSGLFYAGAVYAGEPANATALAVDLRVPDDLPQNSDFYYVLLSVWDTAGSYDQIGFANDYGAWGLAFSTSSYCAGTFSYSADAFGLSPGATYRFGMGISNGTVTFELLSSTGTLLWSLPQSTGGLAFEVGNTFTCNSVSYYGYTDYEEVHATSGPAPPYDFFFRSNAADGQAVTAWTPFNESAPSPVVSEANGSAVTVANEPFYLAFTDGASERTTNSNYAPFDYEDNVSVLALGAGTAVSLAPYLVPAGWSVGVGRSQGVAPFTSEFRFNLSARTGPGLYEIGLAAGNAGGALSRIALEVVVPSDRFAVSFVETGLPPRTLAKDGWTVVLNGTARHGTTPAIGFGALANATSPLLVTGPGGWVSSAGRSVALSGPATEVVTFARGRTVALTFGEKGLARTGPAVQPWCVEADGWVRCSTTPSIRFLNLTLGSHTFAVASPIVNQTISGRFGRNTVVLTAGLPVTVQLSHRTRVVLTFSHPYPVSFTESGLSQGNWSITLKGQTKTARWDEPIRFNLTNGTYLYRVGKAEGFAASGSPTRVTVDGSMASVKVTFARR